MTGPAIETVRLSKHFRIRRGFSRRREVRALEEVSFLVQPGEAFGLIGPNGSGKSTLLRILSTLLSASSGQARVAGCLVLDVAAVRRSLGVVPASPRGFVGRMTAYQNLHFYGTLWDWPPRELHGRIQQVLDVVGLSDVNGPFAFFSTGQCQRLNVARALLHDPAILLLDEPTKGLDPWVAHSVRRWIREELIGRQGKTLLVASNLVDDVQTLCDRAGMLQAGRLVWQGKASEVVLRVRQQLQ